MATTGAYRLLLVCVFFLSLKDALVAAEAPPLVEGVKKAAAKAKELTEASERVKNNLTAAEGYVETLKKIDESDAKFYEQAKVSVECLAAVVKNAVETATAATAPAVAAVAVAGGSLPAAPPQGMEQLEESLMFALMAADNLSKEVKPLSDSVEKLSEMAGKKEEDQKQAFKTKVDEVKGALEKAKESVGRALNAHQQLAEKAAEIETTLEKKPNDSGAASGSGVSGQTGEGKGGTQSQTDATDSATQNSPGGNKPPAGGSSEKDTTLSGIQEDNTSDSTYGGAIATCTAAPLLLLLTAVAYAAVC